MFISGYLCKFSISIIDTMLNEALLIINNLIVRSLQFFNNILGLILDYIIIYFIILKAF